MGLTIFSSKDYDLTYFLLTLVFYTLYNVIILL